MRLLLSQLRPKSVTLRDAAHTGLVLQVLMQHFVKRKGWSQKEKSEWQKTKAHDIGLYQSMIPAFSSSLFKKINKNEWASNKAYGGKKMI